MLRNTILVAGPAQSMALDDVIFGPSPLLACEAGARTRARRGCALVIALLTCVARASARHLALSVCAIWAVQEDY